MGDVLGRVREAGAQADHRRLVAHGVHAGQGAAHGDGVAHIRPRVGTDVVDDGLVPVGLQSRHDLGSDEPGTAGDQYTHALTLGPCAGRTRGPRPSVTGP